MCLPPREEVAKTPGHNDSNHVVNKRPQLSRRVVEDLEDDHDRVTFQDSSNQVVLVQTALSCLEEDQDRQDLWYSRDDIKEFRRQAQILSKKCRDEPKSVCADVCTRGLELRMSLQRQDRKQMIVKRILDAQDDDCTAEELSQIAQQHSIWSRKLALATAHKDYYAAHHPKLTSVLPEMPALLDCSRELSHKRSLLGSCLEQTGRRVRCRMF